MIPEHAAAFIFDKPSYTAAAIQRLLASRFDFEHLSVAAKHCCSCEDVICLYQDDSGVEYWGKDSGLWKSIWQALSGWAFAIFPGVGAVMVAGPLASWMVVALKNAAIFEGLNALEAGLHSIGISKESIFKCENALKRDKYLLIIHGGSTEVNRARKILGSLGQVVAAGRK
jgi:hypothetical protein